jgi:WD40 repeat protein
LLRPRQRLALGVPVLLALAALGWLASVWRTPWPVRAELRTPGDTWPLAFSPDGAVFATSSPSGITVWDTATGTKRSSWAGPGGQFVAVGTFSPDGRTFAGVATHGPQKPPSILVIDAMSGRPRLEIPTSFPSAYDLAFSKDGGAFRAIFSGSNRPQAVLDWDTETGKERSNRTISCPVGQGHTTFTTDGRLMAASAFGSTVVTLWDLEADRQVAVITVPPPAPEVSSLGFTSDGATLAVGREGGAIELWDVPTRRLRTTLRVHRAGFSSWGVRFSPDGATLASRGEFTRPATVIGAISHVLTRLMRGSQHRRDGEVVVLDVATARRLGHAAREIHPYFSPDGRTIATRASDFSVRLRDVPTARGKPASSP